LRHHGVADRVRLRLRGKYARVGFDRFLLDADERLPGRAVEHIDPAGLAGLGDASARYTIVGLIEQDHRARRIEIPQIMMHLLEVPRIGAIEMQRYDR
jgi:hypothetical protein